VIFSVPKNIFFIAIIGTFLCVLTNEINAHFLHSHIPNQFGLIHTADEASYIAPAKNFVDLGVWRDNSNGLTAYYQRPPGYGMLFAINYFLFAKYAFLGMKVIQIACFFFSILLFWRIMDQLQLSKRGKFIATTIFAIVPCYSGFVYFSITEGITPFLLLWSVFEYFKTDKKGKPSLGLVFSNILLLLVRPQLAIFPIMVFICFLFHKNFKSSFFIMLSFIPLLFWYGRTASISKELPSLHPIYSSTNNHLFRPTHAAMTDLYRVWEHRSDVFHTHIGHVAYGDSSRIKLVTASLPFQYQSPMQTIFERYQALNRYQIKHFEGQRLIHSFKGEKEFIKDVYILRSQFIAENPVDYYLKTPFKSAKDFFNKSYLNLYIFQAQFRGNLLVETLRIFCWCIIILSTIFTCCLPFIVSRKSMEFFLVMGMMIFMFYLVYLQRLNEERYIVPILPLFLIFGMKGASAMIAKIKESLKNRS